ncbi:hypothetical protein LPN01_18475 [Sphingomonas sp. A2-49]|uniref:DUF6624 domain-containing protein n=1 Tax=Sphingomonas sp. A2-49 TaxID=1391375 RepID=UPI0021D2A096|nr:DUF6624 domain-containing protein [Sphingomonas sp. A2-49]MCU6456068.1 hypothetical protein [Sphingomonas sp. A2-49]
MIRRLALLPAALPAALIATAEAPPPPAGLAPYIRDGRFDPGDFGWLRGLFDGATPAQVAAWVDTDAWLKRCRTAATDAVRADLVRAGIPEPAIHVGSYGDPLCGAVTMAFPQGSMGRDWARFQAKLASGRRVAAAIVWSAGLAQGVADGGNGDGLPARLDARPITDQVLRLSMAWNEGEYKGAPPLDAMEQGIVRSLTWVAIQRRDAANTLWMKTVVAEHGWPTIATVGMAASANAWLLVQHADDDPVFQLRMLRLMEPLAARGAVAKDNYALLRDRVMLQLTGRQRYGTQWSCATGSWAPFTLEDAGKVDAYRAEAGLGTLAENGERIRRNYGPCPPQPH